MESLLQLLETLLAEHPQGLREYELVRLLEARNLPDFPVGNLQDPLTLFRVHFRLFHHLYTLQEVLHRQRRGMVEIHCLKIRLTPWTGDDDGQTVARPDPLRAYYLDQENFARVGSREAAALLDQFWELFARLDRRGEALAVLGLSDPVDDEAIKRRFRAMAKEHHPDHGGDAERFREIAAAMATLAPVKPRRAT